MEYFAYTVLYAFVFIFGLCAGSFLNVLIWRIPGKKSLAGRSVCPKCGGQIKSRDLIPVLSFLLLKGNGRCCGDKISLRYPAIEVITGALTVVNFLVFGFTFQAITASVLAFLLITVAMIDIDSMEIPNGLVIALITPAIASVFFFPDVTVLERLIGLVCISLPMLLLTLIINGAFGGGDIKLIAVCGFLLGWKNSLFAMFAALILGGGFAAVQMLRGKVKRKQHMPFGQYLCAGVYIALLCGEAVINLYLKFFGL